MESNDPLTLSYQGKDDDLLLNEYLSRSTEALFTYMD